MTLRHVAPEGMVRLIAIAHHPEPELEEESEQLIGDFEIDFARKKAQNLMNNSHFSCLFRMEVYDEKGVSIVL